MGQRYRKMEDQKPWPGLARNQDLVKGEGLKPKAKNLSENVQNWKRHDRTAVTQMVH